MKIVSSGPVQLYPYFTEEGVGKWAHNIYVIHCHSFIMGPFSKYTWYDLASTPLIGVSKKNYIFLENTTLGQSFNKKNNSSAIDNLTTENW